ncbi:MAG: site-specific integrase [Gemmatimonadota bacterium]|nr:site-specific integrase [Gemmatimonadota bacterium]
MAPTLKPHPGQFKPEGEHPLGKNGQRGRRVSARRGLKSPAKPTLGPIKKIQLTAPGLYPELDSGKRDRFRVSSGTRNDKRFRALQTMLAGFRDERRYDVLRALMEKRITLNDLAAAHAEGKHAVARLMQAANGAASGEGRKLKAVVDEYLTHLQNRQKDDWRKVAQILQRFIDDHGGDAKATIRLLNADTIQTWLDGLSSSGRGRAGSKVSNATRNRYRAWLSGLATFCMGARRRYITAHPIEHDEVPRYDEHENHRRMPDATPREYRAYFSAVEQYRPDLGLALRLLFHCGPDVGELLGDQLEDEKTFSGVIVRDFIFGQKVSNLRLGRNKTGTRARLVPVPTAVAVKVQRHIRDFRLSSESPVFGMIRRQQTPARKGWNYPELRAAHVAGCKAAGKSPRSYRIKDLRHMAAITWARAGLRLQDISQLLGHSTIKETEKYAAYMKSEEENAEIAAAGSYYLAPAKGRRGAMRGRKRRGR